MISYALDIDGVLADFDGHVLEYYDVKDKSPITIYEDMRIQCLSMRWWSDKEFWLSIPSLEEPGSWSDTPQFYLTDRTIPVEWTKEWLSNNNYPDVPIVCTEHFLKKSMLLQAIDGLYGIDKVDFFLEDRSDVFEEINSMTDTICYLRDKTYNKQLNTRLRVTSVNQFLTKIKKT